MFQKQIQRLKPSEFEIAGKSCYILVMKVRALNLIVSTIIFKEKTCFYDQKFDSVDSDTA